MPMDFNPLVLYMQLLYLTARLSRPCGASLKTLTRLLAPEAQLLAGRWRAGIAKIVDFFHLLLTPVNYAIAFNGAGTPANENTSAFGILTEACLMELFRVERFDT